MALVECQCCWDVFDDDGCIDLTGLVCDRCADADSSDDNDDDTDDFTDYLGDDS